MNNNNNTEKIVQVPLDEGIKNALEERAKKNGRATGREAQRIITKSILLNNED